jgi:quercetin dioxygenase-like cupin family protein
MCVSYNKQPGGNVMYYFDVDAVTPKQLVEGAQIKVIYGEKIMMSFVDLDPGAAVPEHQHPHEQMGYVFSGELEFNIGGETKHCQAGDAYLIPGNVVHSATVSKAGPAKVLDIFSPPREEYK